MKFIIRLVSSYTGPRSMSESSFKHKVMRLFRYVSYLLVATIHLGIAEVTRQNLTDCEEALSRVPCKLPQNESEIFLDLYRAYNGSGDESPLYLAAQSLLSALDQLFEVPGGFDERGSMDSRLVHCVVQRQQQQQQQEEDKEQKQYRDRTNNSSSKWLNNTIWIRDALVAGGPKNGMWSEAASIYDRIVHSSLIISGDISPSFPDNTSLWDSRNQSRILYRLAIGTACEHAVPIQHRWLSTPIDPIERYLNFEGAYLRGELDPAFEVLTSFELRYVVSSEATDDDLNWMRQSMGVVRPDHIADANYAWRYAVAVRTDVTYQDSIWPDGKQSYRDIPAAGGECGARAWFGRFSRRAFGMPVWGVQQPGHAAMTTWSPDGGWAVLLGSSFANSWWESRGGLDFQLETQSRELRRDFQNVLRGQWIAIARNEVSVDSNWGPRNPNAYGKGDLWSALMLYAKKLYVNTTKPPARPIGPSVVPSRVERLIDRWKQDEPTPNITVDEKGTIRVPSVSFSSKNKSAPISVFKSFDDGEDVASQQIMHGNGDAILPASTLFEYDVWSDLTEMRYLTANISTWHMDQDLLVSANDNATFASVPVFYTQGQWSETEAVEIALRKGRNTIRFMRNRETKEMAIKNFLLYRTRPSNIPPPPTNHTPSPAPPPLSKYIKLAASRTCSSQGLLALSPGECDIACQFFGYKFTGSRQRPFFSGCFVLDDGPWKGNGNFNANATAACCDPTARAVCLRH